MDISNRPYLIWFTENINIFSFSKQVHVFWILKYWKEIKFLLHRAYPFFKKFYKTGNKFYKKSQFSCIIMIEIESNEKRGHIGKKVFMYKCRPNSYYNTSCSTNDMYTHIHFLSYVTTLFIASNFDHRHTQRFFVKFVAIVL